MKLMQQYTIYIVSVLGLFNFFIIRYDVVTDNMQNAILLNELCTPLNKRTKKYETIDIAC